MKKILITGDNSYIGRAVERWLREWPEIYDINEISVKKEEWKKEDFSKYDVVFHVAGIAHVPTNHTADDLYYRVNRDLAIEVAKKAKQDGVKQFIFMSSTILYGVDEPVGVKVIIDKDTIPKPKNAYGISKFEADLAIQELNTNEFRTICVRTCMVYGAGCKGNFVTLRDKIAKLPIIPYVDNCRSMIHIENLANFIKERIDREDSGVFYPQNEEYIRTNDIIKEIRKNQGKNTYESKLLGVIVKSVSSKIPICRKAYGDLAVDRSLSTTSYIVNDFKTSIRKSMS